jgi:hypothetical protein
VLRANESPLVIHVRLRLAVENDLVDGLATLSDHRLANDVLADHVVASLELDCGTVVVQKMTRLSLTNAEPRTLASTVTIARSVPSHSVNTVSRPTTENVDGRSSCEWWRGVQHSAGLRCL